MTAGTFARALDLVLSFEGGFVDHPQDPGGATNLGITAATLSRVRGRAVSTAEVGALTRTEAADIYRRLYWMAVRADDLPPGLDLAVFDCAVNSGPARAVRLLQRALGSAEDGVIGPKTLAAAKACDPGPTIQSLCSGRLAFLRGLSTWTVFGSGWSRRVATLQREALRLAAAAPPAAPPRVQPSRGDIMTETKTIFASRTVWANLIGLASIGLGLAGVQTGAIDANGLADAAAQLVAAGSFIVSTLFRVVARKQLATS